MTEIPRPGFTGARIDRADATRQDPERIAALIASPTARLLRLDGIDPRADAAGTLEWGSLAEAEGDEPLIFLGLEDGQARFAAMPPPGVAVDARSRSAWRTIPHLLPEQAALYAAARSLIDWHARHRFCAQCGAPTAMAKGGWQRTCGGCGAEHFPRTDPVVIMLAEEGDAVLVGRQHGWPPGNFSALAGFVEPGEALEEAVARELFEEAGVSSSAVRYVASQPWPFPSSLMIGCIARVTSRAITLDTAELEAAMWVSRAEVAAALAGESGARFTAPPPFAIANTLFHAWLAGR